MDSPCYQFLFPSAVTIIWTWQGTCDWISCTAHSVACWMLLFWFWMGTGCTDFWFPARQPRAIGQSLPTCICLLSFSLLSFFTFVFSMEQTPVWKSTKIYFLHLVPLPQTNTQMMQFPMPSFCNERFPIDLKLFDIPSLVPFGCKVPRALQGRQWEVKRRNRGCKERCGEKGGWPQLWGKGKGRLLSLEPGKARKLKGQPYRKSTRKG